MAACGLQLPATTAIRWGEAASNAKQEHAFFPTPSAFDWTGAMAPTGRFQRQEWREHFLE